MTIPAIVPRRVLVVDDDPLVADSIRRMLQFDGHQVQIAGSAAEALQLFSPHSFDLVLVDYEMPTTKGDALAQAIKERSPALPVVMFTGYAEAVRSAGLAAKGVDRVLGKPFDLEELRQIIQSLNPQG